MLGCPLILLNIYCLTSGLHNLDPKTGRAACLVQGESNNEVLQGGLDDNDGGGRGGVFLLK